MTGPHPPDPRAPALKLAGSYTPPPGRPWLASGFRPFFLLTWSAAALLVPAWAAALGGGFAPPGGVSWHAHELVFGFGGALLVGFLLTAARQWTGRATASGPALAALVVGWCLGRLAPLGGAGGALCAVLGAAVPVATAIAVGRPILAARSRRNYAFAPLLLLFGALDLLHARSGDPRLVRAAVDVLLVFLVVFGGRVIPLFTGNALGGGVVGRPRWDRAAELAAGAVLLAGLVGWPPLLAAAAAAAAITQAVRALGWRSAAARAPILAVLHVGWAFLIAAYAARTAEALGLLAPATALHVATVGALGTLGLGMSTRVTLGHTGRPLHADAGVIVAYVAVVGAALVRLVAPHAGLPGYLLAAALWCVAWTIPLLRLGPALLTARPDGQPG